MTRSDPREAPPKVVTEPKEEEKPEPDHGIFADLPPRYASHRLALIARDPHWAFAYWDVDHRGGAALFEPGTEVVLRLVDGNDRRTLQSPRVHPESGRYYFRLPAADQRYQALLIAVSTEDGREVEILASNVIHAPPAMPRPAREPRFATLHAQREVLSRAAEVHAPPQLACELARSLAMYDTPSIAGRALTLLPSHEKPRAAPVEEASETHPDRDRLAAEQRLQDVRAYLSGSEAPYVGGIGGSEGPYLPISSAELLK